LPPLPTAAARSTPPVAKRQVYFGTRFEECAVHARESLRLDEVVAGPAVIEESGSTTIIPPGWMARTIGHGELLMERLGHE
jgi:N-methylhydantoinase A/oxoprolinase/acetone carboxylase beta subunit